MTGAMLCQDVIIFGESFSASRDAKLADNLYDHERVGRARSLLPVWVARQKVRDEGRVGHAGLALVLAEPQEATTSGAMRVEVHEREALRRRSRSVGVKNGRGRGCASGEAEIEV